MILQTIDLFSGVGGMSYGFEMAGFKSLLAVEKEPNIAKTYQINFPHSKVLNEDVTNLKIHEVFKEMVEKVDVIFGGPPCQAFSTAGNRLGFDDSRGNVFLKYLDIVGEIKPTYVVIENVRGLLSAEYPYQEVADDINTCGAHTGIRCRFSDI